MNENIRVIDDMNVPDKQKMDIHKSIDSAKRQFLNSIGELLEDSINEDIDPYVEHTNKGLNLRITVRKEKSAKEIEAICQYSGLNKIEKSKTNVNSPIIWLRFTVE